MIQSKALVFRDLLQGVKFMPTSSHWCSLLAERLNSKLFVFSVFMVSSFMFVHLVDSSSYFRDSVTSCVQDNVVSI